MATTTNGNGRANGSAGASKSKGASGNGANGAHRHGGRPAGSSVDSSNAETNGGKGHVVRRRVVALPVLVVTTVLASAVAFFAGAAYRVRVLDAASAEALAAAAGRERAGGENLLGGGENSYNNSGGGDSPATSAEEADPARDVHSGGPAAAAVAANATRDMKLMGGGGQKTGQKAGKKSRLPAPRLHDGKAWPETKYTGVTFPDDGKGKDAVRESHDLHIQPSRQMGDCDGEEEGEREAANNDAQCDGDNGSCDNNDGEEEEEEEHLPAGQHLLVDIKNVEADFLDSEERLAEAMIEVVSLSQLTLLSYHCHALIPAGVSCVGVLLESHISFHTWPEEGVITLDLFTCGSGLLVPVVPVIERLFGVPQEGAGRYHPPLGVSNETYVPREEDYHEEPVVLWSHVLRGFRPKIIGGWRILENDVSDFALKRLEMNSKQVVTTTVTPYQQIDVVDIIDPRHQTMRGYERSLRPEVPTYESAHPELFRPNRMVFLEGVIQSTSRGDEPYHEALVHPAMFAHESPEKVVIIGGGEGSTLREVLKHSTVEKVKMIEIDEMMVNASREFLPGWSDCSDLKGSADSCFDDPRTDLACEDALAWFIDRYGEGEDGSDDDEEDSSDDEEDDSSDDNEEDSSDDEEEGEEGLEMFDVIIMDALDPQDNVEFADALYDNEAFIRSLYGALSDDGILVMQIGISPTRTNPPEELSENKHRFRLMSTIENMGFQSLHMYEESHCGFQYPWSFLVACKSSDCRFNWFLNDAEKDLQIQRRIKRTWSGESPLKYFDGATMRSYQIPPKVWETNFCRRVPTPASCELFRSYDKSIANYDAENFEVRMSSLGGGAGRGTFAKVDIPKGSYIMQEQAPTKIHLSHRSTRLMEKLYEHRECYDIGYMLQYMYGYGFQYDLVADYEYYVDSGLLTFVNHGCNGTNNMGGESKSSTLPDDPFFNEATLDPTKVAVRSPVNLTETFDPVFDRHIPHLATSFDVALRDIKAGEELFTNYLYYIVAAYEWEKEVENLKAQCRGEAIGLVKEDEIAYEEEETPGQTE